VDLAERLWPENLQRIQDTIGRCLGLPVLFADVSGRPLGACEDLSEFCRWFTRAIALSRPCLECARWQEPREPAAPSDTALRFRPFVHVCPLGILDVAVPITAAGETLGYILTAQVCLEPGTASPSATVDAAKPRDAEEHLSLLSRLRTMSEEQMEEAAAALSVVASLLGAVAAGRRRNLRLAELIRQQRRWRQEHEVSDAVTGLANRRHFRATLETELLRARRYQRNLSVAALDIDGFRLINDEFGHDVGDAVLRGVSQCLLSTVRETDFVGRVGGDEFALLFTETARHEALIPLMRVNASIEDLNASGELPVEVRVGIGVVDQAADSDDPLEAALTTARQRRGVGALVVD
jgi:diguanylate cyclase (GGDEF)-like protein